MKKNVIDMESLQNNVELNNSEELFVRREYVKADRHLSAVLGQMWTDNETELQTSKKGDRTITKAQFLASYGVVPNSKGKLIPSCLSKAWHKEMQRNEGKQTILGLYQNVPVSIPKEGEKAERVYVKDGDTYVPLTVFKYREVELEKWSDMKVLKGLYQTKHYEKTVEDAKKSADAYAKLLKGKLYTRGAGKKSGNKIVFAYTEIKNKESIIF